MLARDFKVEAFAGAAVFESLPHGALSVAVGRADRQVGSRKGGMKGEDTQGSP